MNKNTTALGEEESISCTIADSLQKGYSIVKIAHEIGKSKTECEWIIENILAEDNKAKNVD